MATVEALQPAIIYLGAGLAAALVSRAIRISPIVGYLAAGLIIGPAGAGLVEDNEATRFLGELGVGFLLFEIGLHFSLRELRTRRSDIIGLAPLQMGLCALVLAGLGFGAGLDLMLALLIGASLSLSSTAVVGRILADRNLPSCPMGRAASAVLVAQDIVAIFLLVFAAALGTAKERLGMELSLAVARALLALAVALLAGRFVVRPLFSSLAATNNRDAFTVVALFIVLASAAATAQLGLSLTLGAFLAGMAVSDSPYRQVVQHEVKPFLGLLLGLFFITVGMRIDVRYVFGEWPIVLLAAAVLLIVKTGMTFAAARLAGWSLPGATQLAFLLAQGSEFALVVMAVSNLAGVAPPLWSGVVVAAVTVSLVAAPFWSALGMWLARRLAERSRDEPVESGVHPPVLVFGMTPAARFAVDALRDHNIPYMAVDSDPERFASASSDGYDIVYGDARDRALMESLGADRARAIVMGSPRAGLAPQMADGALGPARFIAVDSPADRAEQSAQGLRAHLALAEPKGIELAADLLSEMGVPPADIASWIQDQAERRGLLDGEADRKADASA